MTTAVNQLPHEIGDRVVTPRSDCWIWTGATDRGYGRIWVDGTAKRVHRVVYEAIKGPIPEGLTLDHLCRVRACCNPDHLEPVTIQENLSRAPKWRQRVRRPGRPDRARRLAERCRRGHEYTPENTRFESGWRRCLACRRTKVQCSVCGQERSREHLARHIKAIHGGTP